MKEKNTYSNNWRWAQPILSRQTDKIGPTADINGCPIVAGKSLLAQAEFADDAFITLGIVFLEVVQQAATLADQHEKTAARAMVFQVRLEVLRQLTNALA